MKCLFNGIKTLCFFSTFLLIFVVNSNKLQAQQINIQVMVTPPYSNKLEDYIDKGNNVIINLTNTSSTIQQFKIVPTITGNNGVMVALRDDFLPVAPINMNPGESRSFTYNQLKIFNNNITKNDLITQGISFSLLENTGTLPEGSYTLCIKAIRYGGTELLSGSTGGCASFLITAYDPPIILIPQQGADVKMPQPQLLNFQWTPSGISGKTRYTLKIADITSLNIFNPNDAFNNPSITPYFLQNNIITSAFAYDMTKPKLFKDRLYAVQVVAYDPTGKLSYKNNGKSQAHLFKVSDLSTLTPPFVLPPKFKDKNDGGGNNPPPPPDNSNCIADCNHPLPNNTAPYTPKIGEVVTIGKFSMTINNINGPSGSGSIEIPFLKAKILVDFIGLQVNTDKQAFGNSKATAKIEANNILETSMANDPGGELQMTKDKFETLQSYIKQGNKLVSKFNPAMQPSGVPFAIDNNGFNLNVLGLIFTPEKAYMNILFGYDIADAIDNNYLDFSQKGVCIRPNGYGEMPEFSLKSDKIIKLSNETEIKFLKGDATSVVLSCDGIHTVKLTGEYLISRERLLPINDGNIIAGSQRVKAEFSTVLSQGANWIAETTMNPPTFTIPDAKDFVMTAQGISIDMSEVKNPNNIQFHNNHPNKNGANVDWKGLIIDKISIRLPNGLNKNGQPVVFDAQKIMIDKTGFWGDVSAQNVVSINEGDVGNWAFSIKQISLNIEASTLTGGSLNGDLELPIANSGLGYSAIIQKGNDETNFEFSIATQGQIDVNMWIAKIKLFEGSTVNIIKEGDKYIPSALLNGEISVGFDKSPDENTPLSKMSIDGLKFQELSIVGGAGQPKIDLAFVSLNMQPNKNKEFSVNKFPINLTGLSYDKGNKPGLSFGLKLNLIKGVNGFQAETNIKVKAGWDATIKKFKYDGIELQSIEIKAELGVMNVDGTLALYNEDPKYGTGFRGDLKATMFKSLTIDGMIQVGKIGEGNSQGENASNYRYFMIDIAARWNAGIPIPGANAVAFYGFGGGMYRNMEREALVEVQNDKMVDKQGQKTSMTPGESASGIVYSPKFNTLGFMAAVTLGISGEPTTFNCDLKFTVEFNTGEDFGIKKVILEGNGYLIGKINKRGEELVKVGVLILLDFEKPLFHCNATLDGGFNKAGLEVSVSASLTIHVEPGMWYVKFGEWTDDDIPWLDKSRIQANISLGNDVVGASLNFNAYFMMGTDIGDLPRSPLKVRETLGQTGTAQNPSPRDAKILVGKGFAFGAGIRLNANVNFFVFYCDIEFILGADVLLTKTGATCNGNSSYGINGWYAKGIAYAYLHGDAGLRLKMWGYEGKYSLLTVTAAAEMKAEMPNPNWVKGAFAIHGSILGGMITVDTRMSFEIGTKCEWGDESGLDMPIISEIKPENGDDGNVFTAPQAAFNFYINQPFTVTDYEVKKKGQKRTFKVLLDEVTLKLGNKVIKGDYYFNSAKNGITFRPSEVIEGMKDYVFTVKCHAEEQSGGKWSKAGNPEVKSVKYRTGVRPEVVDEGNLIKAFPQIGQRYFLAGDANIGNINLFSSQCDLMDKKEDKDFNYEYKLRFTNLSTDKSVEISFECNDNNFNYLMPKNLDKETVYELRMIRIAKPKKVKMNIEKNTQFVYKNEKGQVVNAPSNSGNNNNNINNFKNTNNNGGNKINPNMEIANTPNKLTIRHNMVKNEQILDGSEEKELFKYYFRTSKHSTAKEKYEDNYKFEAVGGHQNYAGTLVSQGTQYAYNATVDFPLISGKENMDIYEAYGYDKKVYDIIVEPLAQAYAVKEDVNDYYSILRSKIYTARYKGSNLNTSWSLAFNRYATGNHSFFGLTKQQFDTDMPVQAIKVWNKNTEGPIDLSSNQEIMVPKGRLTQNEINNALKGQKIVDQYPKNPVLPLNYYLPQVALLDAYMIYDIHCARCNDDHTLKKNKAKCKKEEALPVIGGNHLGDDNPFNNKLNPYDKYLASPAKQDFKIKISYGYNKSEGGFITTKTVKM
jgi:TANFOR domain-containing protein